MIFIALLAIALIALYFYNIRTFNYWKDRGVKHDKPRLFFGTNKDNYLMRKSFTQMLAAAYWNYPGEKIVGVFRSTQPGLVIRDPDIIKRILTNDFVYFYGRGLHHRNEVVEPLLRNLFFADGDLWRLLRQRMTPAFTSGKLRAMFPLVVERAERLQARTLAEAAGSRSLDARDLMARYTTDFIGACGFGLDADSLNDDESAFRKLGRKIFDIGFKEVFVVFLKDVFPEIFKNLKQLGRVEKDLTDLVKAILKDRNYQPSGRNDFVDLLLECRSKGLLIGESIEKKNEDGTPAATTVELDDILMTAQMFVFFAAGFETSSSATSYTLHELAYNPDVQKKVQQEIDQILAKHDNKLSYDSIKEMTYLQWTFKEGMRKFPSLGFLIRKCAQRYTFPELSLTIDEGVRIFIPVQALHMDPKYFPEPEEFRPERFDPDVFDNNLKNIYLPFGVGPRACIGKINVFYCI
jgi:cytochrome P450 family 6